VLFLADILVVEDDEAIAGLIHMNLDNEGHQCWIARDGREGACLIERQRFDMVLLDIMLPEIDGYELLEYIKPKGTPVIFLTAKGAVEERIRGLKAGADDYLAKPFQIGELLARVEAVLRRKGVNKKELLFDDVTICLDSRQVTKRGIPVVLTAKEFDLLVELVRNKNVALHRDRLYEKVWKEPFFGETRTLDSHIRRLRRKLEWEERIKTVFRIGYRLEG
jgi:DNA-binding response OmpR family regulator